jgi:gamma-glutamylcyclotransferase (GGCT)/AIG2-like uncharacterized protein YtfP
MVFEIADAELASVDEYEQPSNKRIAATLASGRHAWVYVYASRMSDSTPVVAPPGPAMLRALLSQQIKGVIKAICR